MPETINIITASSSRAQLGHHGPTVDSYREYAYVKSGDLVAAILNADDEFVVLPEYKNLIECVNGKLVVTLYP